MDLNGLQSCRQRRRLWCPTNGIKGITRHRFLHHYLMHLSRYSPLSSNLSQRFLEQSQTRLTHSYPFKSFQQTVHNLRSSSEVDKFCFIYLSIYLLHVYTLAFSQQDNVSSLSSKKPVHSYRQSIWVSSSFLCPLKFHHLLWNCTTLQNCVFVEVVTQPNFEHPPSDSEVGIPGLLCSEERWRSNSDDVQTLVRICSQFLVLLQHIFPIRPDLPPWIFSL